MTDELENEVTPATPAKPSGVLDEQLGEGGKRALESERTARAEAERRASAAEERLQEMERRQTLAEVKADKGLTEAQAARLRGESREELEADADALLAAFAPPSPGGSPARPREAMRSGAATGPPDKSLADVADSLMRGD